jgi:hypothetical protein
MGLAREYIIDVEHATQSAVSDDEIGHAPRASVATRTPGRATGE